MSEFERRYRILGVLGQGGFGRVYRARLEGPQGFVKDVAIKILNNEDAPEDTLRRFRDESRILGLVRDRAIVGVDPPTRLDGRWAVIMEYVEGQSLGVIRRRVKRIPPKVALQIVQEIARAMDKLYRTSGPQGQPLQLLHRDIKPANIQLTPGGEVKVLDFGIARADFEGREAMTADKILGTLGYMPPERMIGVDGPEGDVYSLGVVLRTILTGISPSKQGRRRGQEPTRPTHPDLIAALALAEKMVRQAPEERPTCREVENVCADLCPTMSGLSLRRWAEESIRATTKSKHDEHDELVGIVLTETPTSRTGDDAARSELEPGHMPNNGNKTGAKSLVVVGAAMMGSVGGLVVIVGMLAIGAGAYLLAQETELMAAGTPPVSIQEITVGSVIRDQSQTGTGSEESTSPSGGEDVAFIAGQAPSTPARAEAVPLAGQPAGTGDDSARPQNPPSEVAEVERLTSVAIPTFDLTFTSSPLGAIVYINGEVVGETPLIGLAVNEGDHALRLVFQDNEISQRITVARRTPTHHFWKVGESLDLSY